MEKLLLGIDIGTSACKAALFDIEGNVVAQDAVGYNIEYPQAGYAEQDAEQYWGAISALTNKLIRTSGIKPSQIAAVGVDGQSWSAIPVNADGKVLYQNPIWMDNRASEICESISDELREKIFRLSGNPFQPAYSTPKIMWFKKHRADVYNSTFKFLQSNSYAVYKLTGEFTQDMSQGYGLHFYNMNTGNYDENICEELGLDYNKFPKIYNCHSIVGCVTRSAAAETGLSEGTPVAAGGLDAACATLGAGVVLPGQVQEQGGQAGGMSICMSTAVSNPRLILSQHVVPERWLLQGGTVGGGSLRWFKDEFGNAGESFDDLCRLAEKSPPGANSVVYLPYMAGERSPIWDKNAKAVFYGISYRTQRADIIRAVLEGVAFSLRHNIETAEEGGANVGTLHAMGGASNSRLWTQIKSDAVDRTIKVTASDSATTLGAAVLAGVGAGMYKSCEEATAIMVKTRRTHTPDAEKINAYTEAYGIYIKLYKRLKGM